MRTDQQANPWGQIVAKAWQDNDFKKRLVSNPLAALGELGIKPPHGVQIRVVENTDNIIHLVLPAKPPSAELTDADLAGVAGGTVSLGLVKNLASVFGWSPKQVDQILGRGDIPYTGGGGDSGSSGDDGRE